MNKHLVPKTGALIVAPNHGSYLDPPAVACALPRMVTFMAKDGLFKNKLFGAMIRSVGAFPVRRGSSDIEAIRTATKLLSEGHALLVFPEGTRNDGSTMLALNRGVEMLARKSGAQVLPTAIIGNHRKWGKGRKLALWNRVTVRFGEPMRPEDFTQSKEAFGQELAKRIASLCNEEGYELRIAPDTMPNISSIQGAEATEAPDQAPGSIANPQ